MAKGFFKGLFPFQTKSLENYATSSVDEMGGPEPTPRLILKMVKLGAVAFLLIVAIIAVFFSYRWYSSNSIEKNIEDLKARSEAGIGEGAPNRTVPSNLGTQSWVIGAINMDMGGATRLEGVKFEDSCYNWSTKLSEESKWRYPFNSNEPKWIIQYYDNIDKDDVTPADFVYNSGAECNPSDTLGDGYYLVSQGTTDELYVAQVKDGVLYRDNFGNIEFNRNPTLTEEVLFTEDRSSRNIDVPESWLGLYAFYPLQPSQQETITNYIDLLSYPGVVFKPMVTLSDESGMVPDGTQIVKDNWVDPAIPSEGMSDIQYIFDPNYNIISKEFWDKFPIFD